MKGLYFLAAFLILCMSFNPCADAAVFQDHVEIVQLNKGDVHQHVEQDACSPFCACTCCAVRAITKDKSLSATLLHLNEVNYASKLASSTIEMSISIFQPPKAV